MVGKHVLHWVAEGKLSLRKEKPNKNLKKEKGRIPASILERRSQTMNFIKDD